MKKLIILSIGSVVVLVSFFAFGLIIKEVAAQALECSATNDFCVDDTAGATQEYSTIQSAASAVPPNNTPISAAIINLFMMRIPSFNEKVHGCSAGARLNASCCRDHDPYASAP